MLKCYYWIFHIFPYMVTCWFWDKNFPSKWLCQMISQMMSRLWIFMGIFMFFPPNLYVTSGLPNIWFFVGICTFTKHFWWMCIFTFKLKQLFHFYDPLYGYVVQTTSWNFNFFNNIFENSLFFRQYRISTKTAFFGTSNKPKGII